MCIRSLRVEASRSFEAKWRWPENRQERENERSSKTRLLVFFHLFARTTMMTSRKNSYKFYIHRMSFFSLSFLLERELFGLTRLCCVWCGCRAHTRYLPRNSNFNSAVAHKRTERKKNRRSFSICESYDDSWNDSNPFRGLTVVYICEYDSAEWNGTTQLANLVSLSLSLSAHLVVAFACQWNCNHFKEKLLGVSHIRLRRNILSFVRS